MSEPTRSEGHESLAQGLAWSQSTNPMSVAMVNNPKPTAAAEADAVREAERRWIQLSKEGDLDAFEHLYRAHAAKVYGTSLRLLGRKADAEDMTQRVVPRAWARLQSFRGESAFGTWLRRLTVNLIVDERRSRFRRDIESSATTGSEPAAPRSRNSALALDLSKTIALLAAGPRRVLLLHDVEGFTHAEIAAMLGVTTGTTKTQLFRARRELRRLLK